PRPGAGRAVVAVDAGGREVLAGASCANRMAFELQPLDHVEREEHDCAVVTAVEHALPLLVSGHALLGEARFEHAGLGHAAARDVDRGHAAGRCHRPHFRTALLPETLFAGAQVGVYWRRGLA